MLKIKNLINLTASIAIFTTCAALELDVANHPPFKIISQDRQEFKIAYKVAMQSNTIRAIYEVNPQIIEIPIPIDSSILYPLLIAMQVIYHEKNLSKENLLTLKQLYEKIQKTSFNRFDPEQLVTAFSGAIWLNSLILENVVADKISQVQGSIQKIISILSKAFGINQAQQAEKLITPKHWYLIEKFYYLHSPELRPNVNNLLLNSSPELMQLLQINPDNLNDEGERIIKQWKLSVNDLIDYGKKIVAQGGGTFISGYGRYGVCTRFYPGILNLSGFFIFSLAGLSRIRGRVDNLYLNDNQIVELGNNLNGLVNLSTLKLTNNPLNETSTEWVRQWHAQHPGSPNPL
jgi:hypothetical protein